MAASKGRETLIKRYNGSSYVTIGGLRQKSMSLNDSLVDQTDSESTGRWRELLAAAGVKSMSISGGGVFKDSAAENSLMSDWVAGSHPTLQFLVAGLGTFTGAFAISNIAYQAGHDNETTYGYSFESAGEITYSAL